MDWRGGDEWVHGRIWTWYENRRTYQSIVVIGGLRDSMVAKGWDHNRDSVTHHQWEDGTSNASRWGGRLKTGIMGHLRTGDTNEETVWWRMMDWGGGLPLGRLYTKLGATG